MKYTPKELKGNVNISHRSPLKEFFLLLCGILGALLIVYIAFGFAVEAVVVKMSPKAEEKLGDFFSKTFKDKKNIEAEEKLQGNVDELVGLLPSDKRYYSNYRVHIVDNKMVNALAYPGGNIVVYSGLIDAVGSENELIFVLAHELGHFANRDHLKGLGRSLVLFVISSAVFRDSGITDFLQNSLTKAEMKFSQQQETSADLFALDLLNAYYGHVAGATDFFGTISKKERIPRFMYFFATHRYPKDRQRALEGKIREEGYLLKERLPLDPTFQNVSSLPAKS